MLVIVERRSQPRHILEPVESRLAPDFLDGASAGTHGVRQLTTVFPVQRVPGEQHIAPDRIGCVDAQRFTHRRECEPATATLCEEAAAGEQAHQAINRVRIGAKTLGDHLRGLRPVA
jgi:hypothetical protein